MNKKLGRPKGSIIDPRLKREMARFRLPKWLNDELARIGNAGQLVERIIVSGLGLKPPKDDERRLKLKDSLNSKNQLTICRKTYNSKLTASTKITDYGKKETTP